MKCDFHERRRPDADAAILAARDARMYDLDNPVIRRAVRLFLLRGPASF
jgi:hypothetical protein